MKRNLRFLFFMLFCLSAVLAKAQVPASWQVNSADFDYQMAVVGALNIDGIESVSTQDVLAAFINGQCRGLAKPEYIAGQKRYLVYMNIYSNAGEGTIQFKIYQAGQNRAVDLEQTELFDIQAIRGSSTDPIIFSYPRLSSQANIFTFQLPGQENTLIDGTNITVTMPFGAALTNLVPAYTSSPQAKIYVGTQLQQSALTSHNFSGPVIYRVVSADNITQKEYTVKVKYSNAAPQSIFLSNKSISESAMLGATIGLLSAQDPDGNSTFTYTIIPGAGDTDNAFFQVEGNKLVLKKLLNYEQKINYLVRVKAADADGGMVEAALIIEALNENDTAPEPKNKVLAVAENQAVGALLYTMEVTDPDGASVYTFRITDGNIGNKFTIHAQKGELKLAEKLDYEAEVRTYQLEVTVNDGLNETKATITINITNDNDAAPVVTVMDLSVNESAAIGTLVHELSPIDSDGSTTFLYTVENPAGMPFEVTPDGKIKVKSALDYELVKKYELKIGISDGVQKAIFTFPVTILNSNDELTTISINTTQVSENAKNGTIVGQFTAEDADGLDKVTYSLVSGSGDTENSFFQINGDKLILGKPVDFEKQTTYSVRLRVKDTDSDAGEGIFLITALNENDVAPVPQNAAVSIPENQPVTTLIHTMQVTDIDGDTKYTFKIADGNLDGKFTIQEQRGELRIAKLLDYETDAKIFALEILVNDGVQDARATVTVTVTNENDNAPAATVSNISVKEKTNVGTVLHIINPTDADGTTTFTYRVVDNTLPFAIDASGKISVRAGLDYETVKKYDLRIGINDGKQETVVLYPIVVENENDEKPVLVTTSLEISSFVAPGTEISKLEATDPDLDGNPIKFTLTDTNVPFALTSDGRLTVTQLLTAKEVASYILRISLTDNVNTTDANLTVKVRQESELTFEASNLISPNGDEINDYWKVEKGHLYQNFTFRVYDSQGAEVFFQKGYTDPFWDGSYKGKKLPVGTYIYIVQSEDKTKVFKGLINILH